MYIHTHITLTWSYVYTCVYTHAYITLTSKWNYAYTCVYINTQITMTSKWNYVYTCVYTQSCITMTPKWNTRAHTRTRNSDIKMELRVRMCVTHTYTAVTSKSNYVHKRVYTHAYITMKNWNYVYTCV